AGKLWAGKRPIDDRVRSAQWEASVVADLIGHPVEPMLCVIAPSLTSPSFDHGGVRICGPTTVSAELDRIIDPTDVDAAAAAVQHAFGVAPAARPEQGSRTHLAPPPAERHARPAARRSPLQQAPVRRRRATRQQRPSRTRGASPPKRTSGKRAGGSMGEILKLLASLAGLLLALMVIQSDGFRNAISAVSSGVATQSADRVRERAEEAAASRSTTSVST